MSEKQTTLLCIMYKPNLHNYKVKLIVVKPSPYGDNLDEDVFEVELK